MPENSRSNSPEQDTVEGIHEVDRDCEEREAEDAFGSSRRLEKRPSKGTGCRF